MLESCPLRKFFNILFSVLKIHSLLPKTRFLWCFTHFPPVPWFISSRTFSSLVFTSGQDVNWRKPFCPLHTRRYMLSNWWNHFAYNDQRFWLILVWFCLTNSSKDQSNDQKCISSLLKHKGVAVEKVRSLPSFSKRFFTKKAVVLPQVAGKFSTTFG